MGSLRRVITSRGAEDIDVPIPIPGTPSVVETDKSKTVVTASQKGVGTVNSGEFVTYNFQTGVRTVTTPKSIIVPSSGKTKVGPGYTAVGHSGELNWKVDAEGNTTWSQGGHWMKINSKGAIIDESRGHVGGTGSSKLIQYWLPNPNPGDIDDWHANSSAPRAVYKSSFGGKTTLVWKNPNADTRGSIPIGYSGNPMNRAWSSRSSGGGGGRVSVFKWG